ncbi:hypothetical protein G7074_18060 [Pedobacter sp. HDW13]|nr:hypothetical protein [Pedobacter sp. HDW13]QIL41003.1 hypothetical protein G7074_18060 [Pedobacter sp. HDW13]
MLNQIEDLKQEIKKLKLQVQEVADEYLCRVEGKKFDVKAFDMADRNGEQ